LWNRQGQWGEKEGKKKKIGEGKKDKEEKKKWEGRKEGEIRTGKAN
jgi:hypothetical protein